MTPDCTQLREELGAYVLGSLDEDDLRRVEAHLERCERCRDEHGELASLTGLLDLTAEAPPPVPARVRDRVVADAARRRTRRRWALAAAASALVAAFLGAGLGWLLAPEPDTEVVVPLQEAEGAEASGWVAFDTRDGRVVVELEVEGLEPLPDPAVYEAWFSTADERILSIGQLDVAADGSVTTTLRADGPLEDFRYFWITAEPDRRDPAHEGATVVTAPVPPPR